jgi:hypothetical protein
MDVKADLPVQLSCPSKQAGDEYDLIFDFPLLDIMYLPAEKHGYQLLTLQDFPYRLELREAYASLT